MTLRTPLVLAAAGLVGLEAVRHVSAMIETTPLIGWPFLVLLSIVGLWLTYFILTTLRGLILSYEIQQSVGLDLHEDMLWRRAVVCVAGIAVTTVLWLVLRLFDQRQMRTKIIAVLLLALPASGLIAQVNQLMFAPVQQLDPAMPFELVPDNEVTASHPSPPGK